MKIRNLLSLLVILTVACNAADDYQLGPDSHRKEDVPAGKLTKHRFMDSKIYPGSERDYWIYVPAQYDGSKSACLMVFQDGQWYQDIRGHSRVPIVFDNLIHSKGDPLNDRAIY